MEPLQIAEKIKQAFPGEVTEITSFRDQVSAHLKKDRLYDICLLLKEDPELDFDYLVDVCGVDYLDKKTPRFEAVYHLYSMTHRHFIRLRVQVPEEDPQVRSVVPIWQGANWHERECYDMFGIRFEGHPDLRRVLLPEDWEGHPLRKDYPVEGFTGEEDWHGYTEVVELSKKLREFEWGN